MKKAKVAIIGSGNIGMDLMFKVLRSPRLEMGLLTGISADSPRLKIAAEMGIPTSTEGIDAIIKDPDCCEIVFDATTAKVHLQNAPILKKLGKKAVDMTPAGVGALVVPALNLEDNLDADNINLVSCVGQATIPIVGVTSKLVPVEYAEIVVSSASKGNGPGTRANIDEITVHTGAAEMSVGGAKSAKVLVTLNPADPPVKMHNTVFCRVEHLDEDLAKQITEAIENIVKEIQKYVPGYEMTTPPQFEYDKNLITTMVEVQGAGDYLPSYAGNLDIINQAAIRIATRWAEEMYPEE